MGSAAEIIAKLQLEPHPEGGWFRETWRAAAGDGERASATAIHFLLEAHQNSHWHVVDAAEIWLWHAGDPLDLRIAASDDGPVEHVTLGPEVLAGQSVQHVIPAGEWQAAHPLPGGAHGYTLVSCVVSPGFDFAGFTLAKPGWNPGCGEDAT
ncbi:MAG: cupin domain-containing protein [Sphingomonadaceae bacterium]|nr:cupin domain-containing protein [Sphingomonadaceae bacterium]